MSNQQPTTQEWRRLYEAAINVKKLAPWEWMYEDEVFGVRNPETGETGFVSVMGMAGEHLSIALYPDPAALYAFLKLQEDAQFGDEEIEPERILEIPQIQASFEDRDYLDKEDRDLIKKLGLKFRGANSWPMFRSYSPGLFPWYLTGAEARFLTHALEQLLDVAPRVREDEEILMPTDEDNDLLVRVSREENSKLIWEDEIVKIPQPPPPPPIKPQIDLKEIEKLKATPLKNHSIEFDVRMLPMPVKETERPFFPYLMLIVDSKMGLIMGVEMLQPLPTIAAMRANVPNKLVEFFAKLDAIPSQIILRADWLVGLLKPLTDELNIKLKLVSSLPNTDEAFEELLQMSVR